MSENPNEPVIFVSDETSERPHIMDGQHRIAALKAVFGDTDQSEGAAPSHQPGEKTEQN
ncbi:hypothetical protein [Geodermatophilus normandii]|uniref:Uncharacterized protein n=1 Tax=Geodermatophilus normandii TaxID=1137989 RepID=A0A6P0GKA8_9ACTN|nr:hypothetical protein [Geodermatophilus normandii]NEM07729.1 hypothetical protein [Geodermatophilus normandii]